MPRTEAQRAAGAAQLARLRADPAWCAANAARMSARMRRLHADPVWSAAFRARQSRKRFPRIHMTEAECAQYDCLMRQKWKFTAALALEAIGRPDLIRGRA